MRKNWNSHWLRSASVAILVVTAGVAIASEKYRGGDHLPTPFKNQHVKVELAHGEYYVLEGTVVVTSGVAYLEVDLDVHPWLANKFRKEFPYYYLDGGIQVWRKYDGVRVRVHVQAMTMEDGTIGLKIAAGNNAKKYVKTIK